MINTIFYFVESLTFNDYIAQLQSNEISPKTIVFASEQRSVYKGGRMFGRMLYEDLKTEIEKMFGDDDSPSIRRYIESLINNRAYDDTSLRNALSEVNSAITRLSNTTTEEQNRLDQLLSTLSSRVQSAFEGLLSDANWVQNNMPRQEITWQSGWDNEVKAVLSTVGYWDGDGENWTAKYSRVVQSVNSLSSTVADIQSNQYDGSTVTEAISAAINQAVNDGIASLDLGTSFTQVQEDSNKVKQVIQWLYSGLKSQTSPNYGTFASLYAAGSNNINNAISEIRAEVTKLQNGEYLATSSVESAVDGAIAGLYNKVTNTHASASVFSKIKNNSTAIAGLQTNVEELQDSIDGINTILSSTANLTAALGDANSTLVLKTTYDGDLADLNAGISRNATAIANLTASIDDQLAGLLLDVDTKIGTATAQLVTQDQATSLRSGILSQVDSKIGVATAQMATTSDVNNLSAGILAEVDDRIGTASTELLAAMEDADAGVLTQVDTKIGTATAQLVSRSELSSASAGVLAEVDTRIGSAVAQLASQNDLSNLSSAVTTEIDNKIGTATASMVAKSAEGAAYIIGKVNENGSNIFLSADRLTLTSGFYNLIANNVNIDAAHIVASSDDITLDTNFITALGASITAKKLLIKRQANDLDPIIEIQASNNIGSIIVRDPSQTVDNHYVKVQEIKSDGTITLGNGTFEIPKTLVPFYKRTVNVYSNYPGGLVMRAGTERIPFDRISRLQIEPPFDFSATGDDKTLTIGQLGSYSAYQGTPFYDVQQATFKYRKNEHHASVSSYGPYFYKDTAGGDSETIVAGIVEICSHRLKYEEKSQNYYETTGNSSRMRLRLSPGYPVNEFNESFVVAHDGIDTNGLAELLFDGQSQHCGVFRIGSSKVRNDNVSNQGIRTEVWNGIRIGNCVGEFINKSAIEIQQVGHYEMEEFVNTLNTIIPYKDDQGNTKYLGIISGLIVYNGTDIHAAYTTTGITDPNPPSNN